MEPTGESAPFSVCLQLHHLLHMPRGCQVNRQTSFASFDATPCMRELLSLVVPCQRRAPALQIRESTYFPCIRIIPGYRSPTHVDCRLPDLRPYFLCRDRVRAHIWHLDGRSMMPGGEIVGNPRRYSNSPVNDSMPSIERYICLFIERHVARCDLSRLMFLLQTWTPTRPAGPAMQASDELKRRSQHQ